MDILRTPDDCFANLPDFPFSPNYTEVFDEGTALRIHSVDTGPEDAPPVLLMHGEPSWSYLYRHIIPALAARGHRVLAPDLIGFGRSDKPAAQADYTYERHVNWMSVWLEAQRVGGITLFCQDWGGLIGLRLVAAFPDLFERVIVANTGLPIGTGSSAGFDQWLQFSQSVPVFAVGEILNKGSIRQLSAAEKAAYDAPFPDETYIRQALPDRVQRRRCRHQGRREDFSGTRARRQGPAACHASWRSLPAGRLSVRDRRTDR
jgi:haloalkane dehalogenase